MVKFLLERGASVLILGHHQQTVFDFLGDQTVWTAGFTIPSNESWGKEILDLCNAKKLKDQQLVDSQKLMQATISNDVEAVKNLIAQGVDVNELSPVIGSGNDGRHPYWWLAF